MIGSAKSQPGALEGESGAGINKMQLGGGSSEQLERATSLPSDLLSCRQTGRVRTLGGLKPF